MKNTDERNDTSEVCVTCGGRFEPKQDGGADFSAKGRGRIYFCESCAEEAKDEGLIETDKPENTPEELTVEQYDKLASWAKLARVLTFLDTPIRFKEDVESFFDALSACLNWHPDTDFANYIKLPDGNETFTEEQATALNTRMAECFEVVEKFNTEERGCSDVYGMAMESAQRARTGKPQTIRGNKAINCYER